MNYTLPSGGFFISTPSCRFCYFSDMNDKLFNMKKRLLTLILIPLISLGQSNPGEPVIACDLISDFERGKEFTLKYLNAMPEDKYEYKPTPEILSFREEALHLGSVNFRYAAMIAGGYDASDLKEIYQRSELQTKKGVIDFVTRSYDVMINQIKSESNLDNNTYYYRWNCSKECLARKGFEHQSHHRGKWAIYLRLVGVKPPGEQLIWKDGQRTPRDISKKDWRETKEFKSYLKKVD